MKLSEKIVLDVEVGDTILVGRFKNKKLVVKDIGKDSHGMPTINGRKVTTFRILKTAEEKIKELKGDLQTRERENYHLKQKAELEKFKGELDKISTQGKASGTIFEKRLDDVLGQAKQGVREANAEAKKQQSTPVAKNTAGT